uniref:Uncharacterized protein n=1 Tax=Anguilla anguilla TaxID=7936 RepID=A0A0E9X919_ANGAN
MHCAVMRGRRYILAKLGVFFTRDPFSDMSVILTMASYLHSSLKVLCRHTSFPVVFNQWCVQSTLKWPFPTLTLADF